MTTTTTEDQIQLLRAARDILDARVWLNNSSMIEGNGARCCVLGAFLIAQHGLDLALEYADANSSLTWDKAFDDPLYELLAKVAHKRNVERGDFADTPHPKPYVEIYTFNDTYATSKDEVLGLIDEAIEQLEAA